MPCTSNYQCRAFLPCSAEIPYWFATCPCGLRNHRCFVSKPKKISTLRIFSHFWHLPMDFSHFWWMFFFNPKNPDSSNSWLFWEPQKHPLPFHTGSFTLTHWRVQLLILRADGMFVCVCKIVLWALFWGETGCILYGPFVYTQCEYHPWVGWWSLES